MKQSDKNRPIGVFDSGLGGLSVLKKCIDIMPNENYIYYGDSLHAPYGNKSLDEVRELSLAATDYLMQRGVKGLVVACNTATSAAVKLLRESNPSFPVVGIEPAIKPAALFHPGSMILVMATENTLRESKFQYLKQQYERKAEIIKVPCSGLMEFVERGELEGENVENFIRNILKDFPLYRVGAIVLGCTHYPFLRSTIQKIVGERIEIIDGSAGTAREIRRRLELVDMINPGNEYGSLELVNTAVKINVHLKYDGVSLIPEGEVSDELHKRAVNLLKMDIT